MAEHGEEAAFELLLEDVRGESWVGNEHDVGQVSFGELEGFGAEDANFFCGVHVYVSVSVFVCPYLQILFEWKRNRERACREKGGGCEKESMKLLRKVLRNTSWKDKRGHR